MPNEDAAAEDAEDDPDGALENEDDIVIEFDPVDLIE